MCIECEYICCNSHHYRDIAARNVLLSEDNVAKVANVEFAVKRGNIQKPIILRIEWTAPEAIKSRVRILNYMCVFS